MACRRRGAYDKVYRPSPGGLKHLAKTWEKNLSEVLGEIMIDNVSS